MQKTPAAVSNSSFLHLRRAIKLTDNSALIACLSLGFFIRILPEIFAFPNPIGFDTIYYANLMKNTAVFSNWSTFFTNTWLLSAITIPLCNLSKIDPFMLLKIIAPLLYGLNVAGIYWFARKNLNWSIPFGIITSIFFALQLASLRISWDLLRNTLGLGIMLFALSYINDVNSARGITIFAGLSVLSVFAHEYSAVTLLFITSGLSVWHLAKGQYSRSKRLLISILPALSIFSIGLYLRMFPIDIINATNIISAGDSIGAHPANLFFLVDYLSVKNSVDFYGSYTSLALSVLTLFTLLFIPYLYLTAKGFFKNRILSLWTILLLAGAFGCLIVPFSALQYWHRWMFMLAYPFTFYAIYGLTKLLKKTKTPQGSSLIPKKIAILSVLLTFALGIAYIATPLSMVYANTSVPSASGTYLYFSTNPTVPYQDVTHVTQALNWLNNTLNKTSCVILHHAYVQWGTLYLDGSHFVVTFQTNIDQAINRALIQNPSQIYFVWWNEPIGWYNISLPNSFVELQDFGRISVYVYGGKIIG